MLIFCGVVRRRPPRHDTWQSSFWRGSGDRDGNSFIETENGFMLPMTARAHAERLLATQACTALGSGDLAQRTMLSSAEHGDCAGAIYWAGIGRLVYGLSEHRLREITGNHTRTRRSTCPAEG